MDVTRTAIVHSDFIGRFKDKEQAIELAQVYGAKICSLRYIANNLECTFGFGVYHDDELWGCDDYTWL